MLPEQRYTNFDFQRSYQDEFSHRSVANDLQADVCQPLREIQESSFRSSPIPEQYRLNNSPTLGQKS